ncbi:MAG: BCD family MFS transporter [Chloroflexi bacterium]|nr:BCD family MFS transporter [Chloroflexota bacterium]
MDEKQLSLGRNLKIGLFHLGSGMADVIITGVWNRIMISDLGYAATPVSLLAGLRYFLAPIGIWAGRMSDRYAVMGYRRLFWIWLGRALMALSIIALGLATAHLARGTQAGLVEWTIISLSLLLFSLGTAFSGGTFLALVYDRAAESQRGRAVGIVWTFLLLGFTIGGIVFALLLPEHREGQTLSFTPETLQNLFVLAGMILGTLWFVSLVGEERRSSGAVASREGAEHTVSVLADLRLAFSLRPLRFFFWYLALSMLFAFSQDLILEPFGGDVFGMSASVTTRFTAYWGGTAIVATVLFLFLGRRFPQLNNTRLSFIGMAVLIVTFVLFALSAFAQIRWLVTPGLILLGVGLGVWNVGTLGLMMDMSPEGRAGTFLGFWTLVVTVARGIGVSGGGIVRDFGLWLSGNEALAYGGVFLLGAIGLGVALWSLRQVSVKAFQENYTPAPAEKVLAASLD